MINKMKKITFILLIIVAIVAITTTPTYASVSMGWEQVAVSGDTSSATATAVKDISGTILGVVQVIGVAVAVIMLIVLAIKYISAAPNDKAEIKKHAVVYVVGAVVLFAASGILGIIKDFANTVNTANSSSSTPTRSRGEIEDEIRKVQENIRAAKEQLTMASNSGDLEQERLWTQRKVSLEKQLVALQRELNNL